MRTHPLRIGRDDHRARLHEVVEHGARDRALLGTPPHLVMHLQRASHSDVGIAAPFRDAYRHSLLKLRRDVGFTEPVRSHHPSQGSSRFERGRTAQPHATILPRGAGELFAHARAHQQQRPAPWVGLIEVVERDLAVIAHEVVRRHRPRWHDAIAAEGEVTRVGDVDVNLHRATQPRVTAIAPGIRLETDGRGHRGLQLPLPLPQVLLAARVLPRQAHRCMQRILEDRHPEPTAAWFVEVLVEEDHVRRQVANVVIATNGGRERRQVGVGDQLIADVVESVRRMALRRDVMRPQHVVLARRIDGARDRQRKVASLEIHQRVVTGERVSHGATDQRVDLRLLVVLVGRQRELKRQPDEAGIFPLRDQGRMRALDATHPARVDRERVGLLVCRNAARVLDPSREALLCVRREAVDAISRILYLPQQGVIRKQHVVEQPLAGARLHANAFSHQGKRECDLE